MRLARTNPLRWILVLVTLAPWGGASAAATPTIRTVAGGIPSGLPATQVSLHPGGLVFDGAGNLFVTDLGSGAVLRVAPDGTEYAVAGSGSRCVQYEQTKCGPVTGDGGPPSEAQLMSPNSVAIAPDGDVLVSDFSAHRVRRVDVQTDRISTVAGNGDRTWLGDAEEGPAEEASLFWPSDLAYDSRGNLFVNDRGDYRIRMIRPDGTIATIAGCGNFRADCSEAPGDGRPIGSTYLDYAGLTTTMCSGDRMYLANRGAVFRVDLSERVFRLVAGAVGQGANFPGEGEGGLASEARFGNVSSMACGPDGSLFLMDSGVNRIQKVEAPVGPSSLLVHVAGCSCGGDASDVHNGFGGDGGPAKNAVLGIGMNFCCTMFGGIAVDGDGDVFFADIHNDRVRRVDAETGVISTFAGNGVSYRLGWAPLWEPGVYHRHVTWDGIRDFRFPGGGHSGDGGPAGKAQLATPFDAVADGAGNLYVLDKQANRVRRIGVDGRITTVAGGGCLNDTLACFQAGRIGPIGDGGPATDAYLAGPNAIALDRTGTQLYIADAWHQRIRQVNMGSGPYVVYPLSTSPITIQPGKIQTIFGPGYSTQSPVKPPFYYDGTCNTFWAHCGEGLPATMNGSQYMSGIAVDASGNIHVSDAGRSMIREIEAATGEVLPFAGSDRGATTCGSSGRTGVPGVATPLCGPGTLAFGPDGNLYVSEQGSGSIVPGGGAPDGSRVIRFDMSSRQHVSSVVAGTGTAGFGGDGGPATAARLAFPHGLAFGPGGVLYIADTGNARIRRVKADGTIDTIAGTGTMVDTFSIDGCAYAGDGGPAAEAQLCAPMGLAMAPNGVLYVADQNNSRLRAISGL